ncbi:Fur family transcriptional regulator [Streptomyces sparsogenes]|uniref:Ferric uptake regulation protein n=1 Tax=Streptomyces sparsogenes DSM 40356 TaxID=1331668 RepID=A0A1R1SBB3_9ACTN|nr:Fur family transcriptional regulator [Streptomyces sparsogenes]OMI35625.1 Ferric uptake regulation protein [Streptomyces sparsogenes DSM 40356]
MHDSSTTGLPPSWRATRQRGAVLRALHDAADFTSARELHGALMADGAVVGLTTVYRTLRLLEREGRVDIVRDEAGERLYRSRPADGHRHYLVCRRCGMSLAVAAEAVERWADDVVAATGFSAVEHTVELSGICEPCGTRPDRGSPHP